MCTCEYLHAHKKSLRCRSFMCLHGFVVISWLMFRSCFKTLTFLRVHFPAHLCICMYSYMFIRRFLCLKDWALPARKAGSAAHCGMGAFIALQHSIWETFLVVNDSCSIQRIPGVRDRGFVRGQPQTRCLPEVHRLKHAFRM